MFGKKHGMCDRCFQPTHGVTTTSMFNTEQICMPCKDKERNHPDYFVAEQADLDAIKRGDFNYQGIGLPDDLN